jgi:hypothetical protein
MQVGGTTRDQRRPVTHEGQLGPLDAAGAGVVVAGRARPGRSGVGQCSATVGVDYDAVSGQQSLAALIRPPGHHVGGGD